MAPTVPEDRGGPLLAPAGAIIPMGPEMDYVGQRPDDELTVHVFAGAPGSFLLYEDDGTSFEFEDGACRTQEITQEPTDDGLRVVVGEAQGAFEGAVQTRRTEFVIHGMQQPSAVEVDGATLPARDEGQPGAWWCDASASVLRVNLGERDVGRIELEVRS